MPIEDNDWVKRNITDENRYLDAVAQYEALGFEVKVENLDIENCDLECNECMKETPEKFKVIYTRKSNDLLEDLFND